ncbi:hypothetical protein CASFOL_000683 [Castilleja foliolosa]|uniref:Senescence domain-containing protein n=1 Tax=Castilleja foliolosa TaxID=1961234 RepID=A0ABD3EL22_9LAMI
MLSASFESSEEVIITIPGSIVHNSASFESSEEVIITIPGSIVHLIDKQHSVELANGDFSIVQLKQGGKVVAALARIGDQIQWPLAKDDAAVKLDDAHYFFSLRVPSEHGEINSESILNYGLTVAGKGQESLVKELDSILEIFSAFRVDKAEKAVEQGWYGAVAEGFSPEESSAAYWTTLAPNVEDYSGRAARLIAAGLKWGNEFLKTRMGAKSNSHVSPETLRRVQRVEQLTAMSERVATGLLSGVVKDNECLRLHQFQPNHTILVILGLEKWLRPLEEVQVVKGSDVIVFSMKPQLKSHFPEK